MFQDFLDRTYFYDKHMNKNTKITVLGNCLQQLEGIILENEFGKDVDLFAVAYDDLSFSMRQDIEQKKLVRSSIRANHVSEKHNRLRCYTKVIRNDAKLSYQLIEKLIEEENYIIIRTVDKILPFSIYYDANFNSMEEFWEDGHVILMIGSDDKYYYIVDQLEEVRREFYPPAENRIDIGKFPKEYFAEAFSKYAAISVCKYDSTLLDVDFSSEIYDINRKMIEHYRNNISTRDLDLNHVCDIGGRKALIAFLNCFSDPRYKLNKKVWDAFLQRDSDLDYLREFSNSLTGIITRRKLVYFYWEERNEKLAFLIKDSVMQWEKLKILINKEAHYKRFVMGDKYKVITDTIIQKEDAIFDYLETVFI